MEGHVRRSRPCQLLDCRTPRLFRRHRPGCSSIRRGTSDQYTRALQGIRARLVCLGPRDDGLWRSSRLALSTMTSADASNTSTNQGHPRGLYTLFFTEMWERFSYYGMRALLVLFMTDAVAKGGMGLTDKVATAIYGLYTAAVYLAALPGGWVADRFLGAQRSVWIGGIVIASGQFLLLVPAAKTFYIGLALVVIGTGLLKPNVSTMVGELYPEGGARRDAGFTIFYMGINLGAAVSPLITSALGEKLNWRYGFGAAGLGMVLGLIQFRLTKKNLGEAGLRPSELREASSRDRIIFWSALSVLGLVAALSFAGVIRIDPVRVAHGTSLVIMGVAALYFACLFLFFGLDATEKRRVAVIAIMFLAS